MPNVVTLIIPGKSSGKARPVVNRVRNKAGETKTVTHSPDPGWFQFNVRQQALAAGLKPTDQPVSVFITITRRIPDSWSKKKRSAMLNTPAIATPDGVNVEAAIWDALEGVAYVNDRQVASWGGRRNWGDTDHTEITVEIL